MNVCYRAERAATGRPVSQPLSGGDDVVSHSELIGKLSHTLQ